MTKAKSVVDVILGEATWGTEDERYQDMLAIASVIANRSRILGVTPSQVVSNHGEFNAFDKDLPDGVEKYRRRAEKALMEVQTKGSVHTALSTQRRGWSIICPQL